ncbi:MAG: LysR family transcriptional regulator [Psychromonas sp.]|nr:LysR family transcriptional regulator [Psychromonas sp.]
MKLNYSLDDLRLFWIVVQKGSFTKAAVELAMPLSTLSRRIHQLEKTLQLRLLNRDAHRISLTGTGRQYFERCDALFNEFQYISAELLGEKREASGKIHITAPVNLTKQWLGKALNAFLLQYPNIKIDLSLSNNNIDIVDQSIDIAFRGGESNIPEWIARPLYQQQFILCANSKQTQWHALTHPTELDNYPIILGKPMNCWKLIESSTGELCEYKPKCTNIQFAVDDVKIVSQAIADGLGIGLLPDFIANPLIADGSITQIMKNWLGHKFPIYMIYRDRSNQPHRLRLLIDFILARSYG